MSLGVIVKGSEGVVLAADSRVSLQAAAPAGPTFLITFDNATKLLTFGEPHNYVGAVTYGAALIGATPADLRTAQSFLPELEADLPDQRIAVADFANHLSAFFLERWRAKMPANHPSGPMVFAVGGYNQGEAYGHAYLFQIPNAPAPVEQNANDFGITLGGQSEYIARLVKGYDERVIDIAKQTLGLSDPNTDLLRASLSQLNLPIPYGVLPLQDCIDLAVFLIKTTISAQNLTVTVRGVGGAIDVAVITQRKGLQTVQTKELIGDVARARRTGG